MITAPDFSKKQIVFVLFSEGEKLSFSNDNLVVRYSDGKIKFQCTCYRLFIIYAVGHCSITSVLIQKAKKFGFFIALFTNSFRLYSVIGAEKDGNTLLKRKQYSYDELDLAKLIVKNKVSSQYYTLKSIRNKNECVFEAMSKLSEYYEKVDFADDINSLMGFEGLASKIYFKNHFNNIRWNGRQPRIKRDPVNATLDIGYTLLFSFIDALLCSFGFDTYCGVLHRQFYMRKSLVCDMVEPFRYLIDKSVKKAYNLKQIHEEDFLIIGGQYKLKWEKSADYVSFLMIPLIENKDEIFKYIQGYYRCFMKGSPIGEYPLFKEGKAVYGSHKL